MRRCSKCGKSGHYKNECKWKEENVSDGSSKKNSTKRKIISDKGSDVYLASTNKQSNQDVYFIDSRESYHMTPHKEWLCEYEWYDGDDVLLGDESTTRIFRLGKLWLTLQDGRKINLTGLLNIPGLERNLIYVTKMSDGGMHTLFQKDSCNMVRGAMVLMIEIWIGTLYKLLGNVDLTWWKNIIAPYINLTTTLLESISTQINST